MTSTPQFDHEKLEVYQLQLQFISWLSTLIDELKASRHSRLAEALDQIDRASISLVLNTAEGNGRRATLQRARFFDDARGSATECAACLDILIAKAVCSTERIQLGKSMLLRIVSMLSKLVERFGWTNSIDPIDASSRTRTSRRTRTI